MLAYSTTNALEAGLILSNQRHNLNCPQALERERRTIDFNAGQGTNSGVKVIAAGERVTMTRP